MDATRRTFLGAVATGTALALLPLSSATATQGRVSTPGQSAGRPAPPRLTNLAHLRFLLADVPVTASATHTTFGIAENPVVRAPWTYADTDGAGGYRPVGGGTRDPLTGRWSQGAYNADDIARAAVVFLRDFAATGDAASRDDAREVLRSLAFLQTTSGPNAGRVVLWQQEDGSLNPSAIPVELPDPSDSAESYWLARSVWAFGEGYAAFHSTDPAFASFLLQRLHLCLDALDAESLSRAGQYVVSDGRRLPAWLIAGGADATAEAMLGLAAVAAVQPGDTRVLRALRTYASGVAAMASTDPREWPFGAVLPWTGSIGFWHAWGAAAPEALAVSARILRQDALLDAAVADAGSFTPLLLASGGPANAWAPVPAEAQIAYGAHGRVAATLAASRKGDDGLRLLAGLAAGWFFGANTAGERVYDPQTGVTFDGVETDGRINRNSGAESTIHGLLTMLLLDANPDVAGVATRISALRSHRGVRTLEVGAARLSAGATIVRPDGGAWTGEGNLPGGAYVHLPEGEWAEFDIDASGSVVHGLVWRTAEEAGEVEWKITTGGQTTLTRTPAGRAGDRGLTEADGMLVPQRIGATASGSVATVRCTSRGEVRLSALLLQPRIADAVYATVDGPSIALYVNATDRDERVPALVPGTGRTYDASGKQVGQAAGGGRVRVRRYGFTVTGV